MKIFAALVFFNFPAVFEHNRSKLSTRVKSQWRFRKLLRWRAFWEGPQSLPHYRPGMVVDATIASYGREVAVFLAEIQTTVYLTVDNGEIVNGDSRDAYGGRRLRRSKSSSPITSAFRLCPEAAST